MEDVISKKFHKFSQGSIVSTMTRLWSGWSRVGVLVAVNNFFCPHCPDQL